MEAHHVHPARWDGGHQPAQEIKWRQHDLRLPGEIGLAKLQANLASRSEGESFLGKGRPQPVTEQTLQLYTIILIYLQICMQ